MKLNTRILGLVFLALGGIAADAACSSPVNLEGLPCPCDVAYTCCAGKCVSDVDCPNDGDRDDLRKSSEVHLLTESESPLCLAVDPATVFWMNKDGSIAAGITAQNDENVVRSRSNPAVQTVTGCAMVRAGDSLYVVVTEANSLLRFSVRDDGTGLVLGAQLATVASFDGPRGLAQDAEFLYVLEGKTGAVRRLPKSTPTIANPRADSGADAGGADSGAIVSAGELLGAGASDASELIVDGDSLYWLDRTGVRKMPKTGGPASTIAGWTLTEAGFNLVAAGGNLYWLESRSLGNIMTVPTAGGVAHELPHEAPSASELTGNGANANGPSSSGSDNERSSNGHVTALASNGQVLYVARGSVVSLLNLQGGQEKFTFRYQDEYSTANHLIQELLFDTARYIWVLNDGKTIGFRPVVESDPRAP